ncbi:MAG: hypothetical protein ACK5O2_16345 [Microthrixaceae bacterium]
MPFTPGPPEVGRSEASSLWRLACHSVVESLDPAAIEAVGVELIEAGFDHPAIINLASASTQSEASDELIVRAVSALDWDMPTKPEAAVTVAKELAWDLVSGRNSAPVVARAIWQLSLTVPETEHMFLNFVGLASEWEDDPVNRAVYEEDIEAAALNLLMGTELR